MDLTYSYERGLWCNFVNSFLEDTKQTCYKTSRVTENCKLKANFAKLLFLPVEQKNSSEFSIVLFRDLSMEIVKIAQSDHTHFHSNIGLFHLKCPLTKDFSLRYIKRNNIESRHSAFYTVYKSCNKGIMLYICLLHSIFCNFVTYKSNSVL